MAIVIKPITLEVSKPNVFQAIAAKQNDCNSRFLKATFVDEGEKIFIPSSAEVTINAERNDGQSNSFFGEVNADGTATVPIHSWILELAGYVDCDVSIIEADSKLTSTTFTLLVEEASHGDGDISVDKQFNVLGDLIKEVNAIADGMNNEFAGAIKNTVSGSIVNLTDISPIEHQLSVNVSSANLIPYPYRTQTELVTDISSDYDPYMYEGDILYDGTEGYEERPTSEYLVITDIDKFVEKLKTCGITFAAGETKEFYINSLLAGPGNALYYNSQLIAEGGIDESAAEELYNSVVFGDEWGVYVEYKGTEMTAKFRVTYTESYSTTQNGVTFTDNGDCSVAVKGEATGNCYFYLVIGKDFGASSMLAGTNESATNGEYVLSKHLMYYSKNKELYIYIPSGTVIDETLHPQLARGTTLPPYTPYIADVSVANIVVNDNITYPINTDGTVEGVTSQSPDMTLCADVDGLLLDATYIVDTKKYIDNKIAEIAAMIVNS